MAAAKKPEREKLLARAIFRAGKVEAAIKALNEDTMELLGYGMEDRALRLLQHALNRLAQQAEA